MSFFVPPGFWLLRDRDQNGESALRGSLATGELKAFHIERDGRLHEISSTTWISQAGEAMLETGYFAYGQWHKYTNGWAPLDRGHRGPDDNLIVVKEREQAAAPKLNIFKPKGGRPTEIDWESIAFEIGRIAHNEGLPVHQSALIERVQRWYAEHHDGREPGDTEMKKRVSAFYKVVRSET